MTVIEMPERNFSRKDLPDSLFKSIQPVIGCAHSLGLNMMLAELKAEESFSLYIKQSLEIELGRSQRHESYNPSSLIFFL